MSHLSGELARVKSRVDEMWKIDCAQVVTFDKTITEKDAEIELLTAGAAQLEGGLARALEVETARSIPAHNGSCAETAVRMRVLMTPTS